MGIAKKDEKAEKAEAAEAPEDLPVVKQLKEICDEYAKIEMEFEKKVEELQIEYTKKQKPLLQQRKEVLMKAEGENAPATGTPALMGFWLKAMQNHPAFEELIQEWDEPVLEFLQDITSAPLDETDCNKGFELIFKFAPNPYFANTELKKVYSTERGSIYNGDIDAKEIKVDVLKWNTGKDVTVDKVSKKAKGGGAKKAKQKKEKEEARPSFFRDFFRNLKPGEPLPDDAKEQARMMAEDEEEEDDSDASQSTPSPQWGRPRSAQELNEQERLNLRAVLVAVDQPFPRLRRTIPLPLAVQIAHALWEDGSLGDEGMVARLSEAVRTFPSEVVGRTLSLGSNLRRWSEGIFASASNFSCAAATSPSFSRKNSETLPDERGGAGLRDSIRNRGGLRRGCSGSFVPSSPSAVSASGSTEVVPNVSDAQQGLARDVDVSEVCRFLSRAQAQGDRSRGPAEI